MKIGWNFARRDWFLVLELESIFLGVSQSRNPNLTACFYRMRLIESYGTGNWKDPRAYKAKPLQAEFETAKNVFRVTLQIEMRQKSRVESLLRQSL